MNSARNDEEDFSPDFKPNRAANFDASKCASLL